MIADIDRTSKGEQVTLVGERTTGEREPGDLQVGEVFVRSKGQVKTESGRSVELRRVAVGDISTPEGKKAMLEKVEVGNQILKDHPEWPIPDRDKDGPEPSNPVSREFFRGTMLYWKLHNVPYAEALFPLQRPDDAGRFIPGGFVDEHAMDIFINHEDSIAIRTRGAIHEELVSKKVIASDQEEFVAVAAGAGAGVPNIDTTVKVKEQYGKRITWTMLDTRYTSLEEAVKLAAEAGIPPEDIKTQRADYRRAFRGEDESVDIFDMLGLWEYLPREQCVEVVREAYRLLKPEGVFIASNMLTTRPNLDFHQRGVEWPYVEPREFDDLVDIIAEAGIDLGHVTMTISDEGVYAVIEIRKP